MAPRKTAIKSADRLISANLTIYRGSYMSAHVLLNLLNELGKVDRMRGLSLINSKIQEHEC